MADTCGVRGITERESSDGGIGRRAGVHRRSICATNTAVSRSVGRSYTAVGGRARAGQLQKPDVCFSDSEQRCVSPDDALPPAI